MLEGSCHCGAVSWRMDNDPDDATACNCTLCRRYGVLWSYGHADEDIHVVGETKAYTRGREIGFHFCPTCGCVICWIGLNPGPDGRRRAAVNIRLAEPDRVAHLPVDHFEGLVAFKDLPRDGRTVGDYWF